MEALRRVAARRRVSLAAVIREVVDQVIAQEERAGAERVFRSVGRHGSGRGDVARDHDRHLGEAFDA
jgi:hypothetical protein